MGQLLYAMLQSCRLEGTIHTGLHGSRMDGGEQAYVFIHYVYIHMCESRFTLYVYACMANEQYMRNVCRCTHKSTHARTHACTSSLQTQLNRRRLRMRYSKHAFDSSEQLCLLCLLLFDCLVCYRSGYQLITDGCMPMHVRTHWMRH